MEESSYGGTRAHAPRLALWLAAALAAAALGAGCGDSAEPSGPTVSQQITREFGHEPIAAQESPLEGHRTVLRLLRAHEDVETAFNGSAVAAIDGSKARWEAPEGEDETTWALIVNGIEADEQPSRYELHPGDLVQWDLRDWYVTLDVRATVGAFPETFTRGVFGRRFPLTVECSDPASDPCAHVRGALRDAGVRLDDPSPPGGLPPRGQPQRAKVLVGPWNHWRGRAWPRRIDDGARYSGVFARFSPGADELRLLDWNARHVRDEGAGTGLVAAMRPTEEDLLWLVTGVDDTGVARAARALSPDRLRNAFAVAVTADGVQKLPLEPR